MRYSRRQIAIQPSSPFVSLDEARNALSSESGKKQEVINNKDNNVPVNSDVSSHPGSDGGSWEGPGCSSEGEGSWKTWARGTDHQSAASRRETTH